MFGKLFKNLWKIKAIFGPLMEIFKNITSIFNIFKRDKLEEEIDVKHDQIDEIQEEIAETEKNIDESDQAVKDLKEEKEQIDPDPIEDKEDLRDFFEDQADKERNQNQNRRG